MGGTEVGWGVRWGARGRPRSGRVAGLLCWLEAVAASKPPLRRAMTKALTGESGRECPSVSVDTAASQDGRRIPRQLWPRGRIPGRGTSKQMPLVEAGVG